MRFPHTFWERVHTKGAAREQKGKVFFSAFRQRHQLKLGGLPTTPFRLSNQTFTKMGSQTTILHRLRRLWTRRNSDEDGYHNSHNHHHQTEANPSSAVPVSKRDSTNLVNHDTTSSSSTSATSKQRRPQSNLHTTDASVRSLASRRRVSFGSLGSREGAPPSGCDLPEPRQTSSGTQSSAQPSNMNGSAVVRVDPKVLLLRSKPNDAASILTIASSSKRRRSLDTNASTRALAAESIFSSDAGSIASTQH